MGRKTKSIINFQNAWTVWQIVGQRLPDPDPVLRKLAGGISIYRDLIADPHAAACLRSRKAPLLAKEWELSKEDCPARVFKAVSGWFSSAIDWIAFLADVMDVVFWGYYPVELIWELSGGLWFPVRLVPKPPEWFTYTINQAGDPELRFLSKQNMITGEPIPDKYTIICPRIDPSYDNPYGRGVAGQVFWPVTFKKAGMEFWLNFLERFGQPWVKGTSERVLKDDDLDVFSDKLKNLVQDAVIALSAGENVELLSEGGKSASSAVFQQMCVYQDSQISKAILGQTLTTEVSDKGALATAKVHEKVRSDIVESDVKTACFIQQNVLDLIMERNGYPRSSAPKILPYEQEDIGTDRAGRDVNLTKAMSLAGTALTPVYFKKAYNLDDEDIAGGGPVRRTGGQAGQFASPALPGIGSGQAQLEKLIDGSIKETDPIFEDFTSQIIEIVKECRSYDEVVGKLFTAFPYAQVNQLTALLSKAIFNSQLWGRVHAD